MRQATKLHSLMQWWCCCRIFGDPDWYVPFGCLSKLLACQEYNVLHVFLLQALNMQETACLAPQPGLIKAFCLREQKFLSFSFAHHKPAQHGKQKKHKLAEWPNEQRLVHTSNATLSWRCRKSHSPNSRAFVF